MLHQKKKEKANEILTYMRGADYRCCLCLDICAYSFYF